MVILFQGAVLALMIAIMVPRAVPIWPWAASGAPFEFFTVAAADLAALALIILGGPAAFHNYRLKHTNHRPVLWLLIFTVLALGSLILAAWPLLGVGLWLKLVLATSVWFVVVYFKPSVKPLIRWGVVAMALVEAILGIAQFALQKSVGLTALGEAVIAPSIPGVAKISLGVERVIRAYGTLPHPNILAALLAVGLVFLLGWYLSGLKKHRRLEFFFWAALPVLLLGLAVTFSRVAIIATVVAVAAILGRTWFKDHSAVSRRQVYAVAGAVLGAGVALFFAFSPLFGARVADLTNQGEGQTLRQFYDTAAQKAVSEQPLLGVGLGNFVPWLHGRWPLTLPDWAYQPSHNTPLLITAEVGGLALIILAIFILSIIWPAFRLERRLSSAVRRAGLAAVGILLLTSLTDHFLWTNDVGRYLWWLVIGVI